MAGKLLKYNLYRPEMQTMDLLQWKSPSLVGKIIRWKTHGDVNHSGVVIRLPDIDRERLWTLEATGKGLMMNFLSSKLNNFSGQVWWHPVKPGLQKEARMAVNWMMQRIGTPYDYGGLFKNILGKVSADAAALFCSEAIFLGWQFAAIHLGVEILKDLIDIKDAPVPPEMPALQMYQPEGTTLL